jgi:Trypsin-like peptidase domain
MTGARSFLWSVLFCAIAPHVQAQQYSSGPDLRAKALPYIVATSPTGVSRGSGVIIDPNGTVLTALHVVHGATKITAQFQGDTSGMEQPMVVAGIVSDADLALLRLPARSSPYEFYPLVDDSWKGRPGDPIVIPGHPLRLGLQRISGELTQNGYALSETFLSSKSDPLLKARGTNLLVMITTAPNGLSGAPVLTKAGQVAAILSGSYAESTSFSFASPASYLHSPGYERIEQPPLNAHWPKYTFADLGYLRSFNGTNVRIGPCDDAIKSYEAAALEMRAAAYLVNARMGLVKPSIDKLKVDATVNDESRDRQLRMLEFPLQSPLENGNTKAQSLDQAWSQFIVACDTVRRMKSASEKAGSYPITENNAVFSIAAGKELYEANQILAAIMQNPPRRDMEERMRRLIALVPELDRGDVRASFAALDEAAATYSSFDAILDQNKKFIDHDIYTRDFLDRQEQIPWETDAKDRTFTSLGVTVKPGPHWMHVTQHIFEMQQPDSQLAETSVFEKQTVLLRFLESIDRPSGSIDALILHLQPLAAAQMSTVTEVDLRKLTEKKLQEYAAHLKIAISNVRSTAWKNSGGWKAWALADTSQTTVVRLEKLIGIDSSGRSASMDCLVHSAAAPLNACQIQFDAISVNP